MQNENQNQNLQGAHLEAMEQATAGEVLTPYAKQYRTNGLDAVTIPARTVGKINKYGLSSNPFTIAGFAMKMNSLYDKADNAFSAGLKAEIQGDQPKAIRLFKEHALSIWELAEGLRRIDAPMSAGLYQWLENFWHHVIFWTNKDDRSLARTMSEIRDKHEAVRRLVQ